ncbi:restriction endonuclease subunit S [Methylicorpusculum sp.]|uniref:restriction endonuclease subunit S n=1 Tax=Methylicorpusculum sp. TaxID=2713644 RepID=UPI0027253FE3|nr:restriction endonuclease subunit S [Methylicorpusculum sp.]MDO8845095.1 restriction endonuclease subunit S [Methylicorpusculum sp.]
MSWAEKTIGDLVELQRGHDLPDSKRTSGNVPVVGSAGITGYHNLARAKAPGVTLGRSGASIGKVTFVSEDFWPHNACLYVKDFKGNDPRFVAYLLGTVPLAQLNSGAAQPSLNRNFVYGVKIKYPRLEEQKNIVNVLDKYDDLIENNKRRIELLEESARQLYKEWFVRFRFPGHEHVKIIDGLPEGWARKSIFEMSSYLSRGMTPSYDEEGKFTVINQKCIRNRLLSLELARKQSKDFNKEKLVRKGDVLINSTGTGTLGRVSQCWNDIDDCTVDTHVTIARPNESISSLWYGYTLLEMEQIFEGMGEGSTNQKELKRDLVGALKLNVPPETLQEEFHNFSSDIVDQIINLIEQNTKLIKVRDLLLPKLMSGEIAV